MKPVTKTSVTASFLLKEPNIHLQKEVERNETIIVFRVSSGRSINVKFSTGYKINPKYWDKEGQKVRNVAAVTNSTEINNYLDSLRNSFNKMIAERVAKGEAITKKVITETYDIVSNKKLVGNVEEEMTFFKYCEQFIQNKEKKLPKKRWNQSETVGVYKQAIKHLKEFQKDEGFIVDFDTIDLEFYYEFLEYMQTKEKSDGEYYSVNTIGKHLKTLKTILNEATINGYNTNLKYKHPEFKIIKEITTAIYLDNKELKKMFKLDLSELPEHSKARDIFILGCETGQRVSDYNNFCDCRIINENGSKYFVVNQKKTGNEVHCFITPVMADIMNKRYNGQAPPKMPEPIINKLIKEVGDKAKINEVVIFERTEGRKKIKKEISKFNLITTHTARRTFATNKFKAGIPPHDIMPLTGHKTEKEFLKYIREDVKSRIVRVTQSEAFKKSLIKV